MLSYALAIAVATSSLVLFLTAFLMSDIHRKDDFLWSGVGLFYALVLWYCARNITGAVLLGQAAATALLVSYSWQTLKLRRAIANPDKAAEINSQNFSLLQKITGLLKRNKPTVKPATPSVTTPVTPKVTEQEIAIPDTPAKDIAQTPAPNPVRSRNEVSAVKSPVTDQSTTVKNKKVDAESKLTEAESLSRDEPDDRASDVEPILSEPTKDNTSTQDKEIVKPQPVEPKVVVQDNPVVRSTDSTENIAAKNEPKVTTKESVDTTTGDRPQVESDQEIESEPQTTATKEKVEPVTKGSSLDSLETVEVAEVLDAAKDDTIDLDTEHSNIIEVTTTEINITTEVKTSEPNQGDDSDSRDK
jgi:hypothetical protein